MEFERVGSGVGQVARHFTIVDVPLVATRIEALLPASFAATGCLIQASHNNPSGRHVYVGDSTVTTDVPLATTTGITLTSGASLSVDAIHLHDTYVIARFAGLSLTVLKV